MRPVSPTASRSRGGQAAIAGRVPERVVDGLEVVEVDQDDGDARAAAQRVVQPALEARAVGEAGAGVDERALPQLGLELALLGEVAQGEHDARHVGIVDAVGDADVGVDGVTGRVPQQQVALGGVGHPPGGDKQVVQPAAMDGVNELLEAVAVQLGDRTAEQRLDRVGGERDRAALVEHEHRVGGVLDEGPEAALGVEQRRALAGLAGGARALALGGAAAAGEAGEQQTGQQRGQGAGAGREPPGMGVVVVGDGPGALDLGVELRVDGHQLSADVHPEQRGGALVATSGGRVEQPTGAVQRARGRAQGRRLRAAGHEGAELVAVAPCRQARLRLRVAQALELVECPVGLDEVVLALVLAGDVDVQRRRPRRPAEQHNQRARQQA
jgi:hypothetical protein